MNRIFLFLILCTFVFACSKEKKSLRQLDGKWEMISYNEISAAGLTKEFGLISGETSFQKEKGENSGQVQLKWNAIHEIDTSDFNFNGRFTQLSEHDLKLESSTDTLNFHIVRQLKKDMKCELKLNSGRFCVLIFKKKS